MIGIDFGHSITHVALLERGMVRKTLSVPSDKFSLIHLQKFLKGVRRQTRVGVTGGSEKKRKEFIGQLKNHGNQIFKKLGLNAIQIDELEAIAAGASKLAGRKNFVVANVGTGTPILIVRGRSFEHCTGTDLGGGFIQGLGRLLTGKDVEKVERISKKGDQKLDILVKEIVGKKGIGPLTGDLTAASFGKAHKAKGIRHEDLSHSLFTVVGNNVGQLVELVARYEGIKSLVFTGGVIARSRVLRERLKTNLKGHKVIFPNFGEHCTAVGAALKASKRGKR